MINELLLDIAHWMEAHQYSQMLLSGYYSYNWLEATHVLTLMLCIGSLFIIDLRMLGWALADVPASKIAARLHKPMLIGFTLMFITGALLVYAKPVETIQSLWFRMKMILLVVAAINAWIFNKRLDESVHTWDTDRVAPKPLRRGAIVSLCVWSMVVVFGRYIPYDWVDCDKTDTVFILWAAGCVNELQAL